MEKVRRITISVLFLLTPVLLHADDVWTPEGHPSVIQQITDLINYLLSLL